VEVDGHAFRGLTYLAAGNRTIAMRSGAKTALLLPQARYAGLISPGRDNEQLFADVYN
jgi:hypothetical protein